MMLRPVNGGDDLKVKADHQSIMAVLRFVADQGVSIESLSQPRQNATSGEKYVWKAGDRFYRRGRGSQVHCGPAHGEGGNEASDEEGKSDAEDASADEVALDGLSDASEGIEGADA